MRHGTFRQPIFPTPSSSAMGNHSFVCMGADCFFSFFQLVGYACVGGDVGANISDCRMADRFTIVYIALVLPRHFLLCGIVKR